jgi:predicted deacylase
MTDISSYKYADTSRSFVIDKVEIPPGSNTLVSMNVGRLPSDTPIYVTAHIYRAIQAGPTVLLLAGVHGDEINGIESLRGLIESEIFTNLKAGNLIVVPLLNVFGFINFSREVPDGKDINRSFPGSISGSLASRVARVISKKILPHTDYAIDLHTGGASRYNYPQIRYTTNDQKAQKLAEAFKAPYTIAKPTIAKSFRKISKELDIPAIVFEGGESIRLDGFSIEKAREGILRTLHSLEMGEFQLSPVNFTRTHVHKTSWIRAPYSGIFIWSRQSGAFVQKNEVIGLIKDPYGRKTVQVSSHKAGYIIGHNNASVVNHGDALYNLAYDYSVY